MNGLRILGPADRDAHPAWCALIRTVFPRAGFERWIDWGCWDEDYRAYALYDGGWPVANVSLTRMQLLLDGRERRAWQLGAVATHPEHRGRGHGRLLMDAALADCADDPMLLFANPRVLDFYPRFGFQAREETIFGADHEARPAGDPAPRLDPEEPATRALIRELASAGRPSTRRFGARGHGQILLWYLANRFAPAPRQPRPGVLVCCEQEGDCLNIHEVLARDAVELPELIPALIDAPIRRLRFGFTPEDLWPGADAQAIDPDSFLHVRGFAPAAPHRFPLLAHT